MIAQITPRCKQSPMQRVSLAVLCDLLTEKRIIYNTWASCFHVLRYHDCLHTIYSDILIGKTHAQIHTYTQTTAAESKFQALPTHLLGYHMLTESTPVLKSGMEGWLRVGGKICTRRSGEIEPESLTCLRLAGVPRLLLRSPGGYRSLFGVYL